MLNEPEKIENIESVEKLGIAIKKGVTEASDEMYNLSVSLEDMNEQIATTQEQLDKLAHLTGPRWKVKVDLGAKTPCPT